MLCRNEVRLSYEPFCHQARSKGSIWWDRFNTWKGNSRLPKFCVLITDRRWIKYKNRRFFLIITHHRQTHTKCKHSLGILLKFINSLLFLRALLPIALKIFVPLSYFGFPHNTYRRCCRIRCTRPSVQMIPTSELRISCVRVLNILHTVVRFILFTQNRSEYSSQNLIVIWPALRKLRISVFVSSSHFIPPLVCFPHRYLLN